MINKSFLISQHLFSKRSNFISRLSVDKRSGLLSRLTHLAASWGGKDNGFGLAKCCSDDAINTFPESATTLHFEFYSDISRSSHGSISSEGGGVPFPTNSTVFASPSAGGGSTFAPGSKVHYVTYHSTQDVQKKLSAVLLFVLMLLF